MWNGLRGVVMTRTIRTRHGDWPAKRKFRVGGVSCQQESGREYDLSMSERKARLTITVDPHLSAYAEHLVDAGQATSVSAAFNEAMAEKAYRDRRRRSLWKAKSEQADPDRVTRMMAHVDRQLAQ
jgi:hypothetical protein